ncbi:MAG: TonB-dependent receptor [Acidobacteriota bacterium]|nr:TonB-dependent receptor [Acidobacteriota bacterium]
MTSQGVVFGLILTLLSLAAPLMVQAQVSGATLSGTVTDPSGAVVPNATISIRNTDTGAARNVTTNGEGFYSAPNLNPGNYEIKISAKGFSSLLQKDIVLTVSAEQTFSPTLAVGRVDETVVVQTAPPSIQTSSSTMSATVDGTTVRELPLNGRDWTSLATLEPGVLSVPNQATTGFSANKGNRGFGNQLSDGGHRPNENTYRVNGMVINDYTNAAPGGATGVNLGVDAIDQFSVLTGSYTSEYGRTSGAVIDAITKSGTNNLHGTAFFFDRDKIFDARNFFDGPAIPSFRRIQFGAAAGMPIVKDKTFAFVAYEGIRQSQPVSIPVRVPNAGARAAAVPAIVPYLALWPTAPAGAADTVPGGVGVQSFNSSQPTRASENYVIARLDHHFSDRDQMDGTYFFDSGPQTQADPLGNTIHQVFSRRQLVTAEETHAFNSSIVNNFRAGASLIKGLINDPVSGSAVATNATLAVAPGAVAPPQLAVSGLTTAYGLGGFNRFNHDWMSLQFYDDAFITKGNHSMKIGGAFERMHYNVLEQLSPNGRFNTYTLAKFLANTPNKLNALAPNGSHPVAYRESLFAAYFQDDWHITKRLTLNLGLRYEATTRPKNANTVPAYTVNGYTVNAGGFQQITTLSNCTASATACGPVATDSPIASNPTTKDFEPRLGMAWDPTGSGRTAVHAAFGMFDVLPLPYEFALNTAATAPFQIIGSDSAATLGTGVADPNISFNPQTIRNRYIQQDPKRAAVYNWNANVQHDLGGSFSAMVAYVGSRSVHLSTAADDINLVQPTIVPGVGIVFPASGGTRVDPNWGGSSGIRPVIFDGASSYHAFEAQVKKAMRHSVQGQFSYTFSHCNDLSSAPVTGDTFLNSIAVPLLSQKSYRVGPCDFDLRQVATGNVIVQLPVPDLHNAFANGTLRGWEMGGILTAETGAPFTVTVGGGNDPLGTGYNGDYSMDFADLLPNCNATGGSGVNYVNRNCFTPPTAPTSLAVASASNPYGCAPSSFASYGLAPPAGRQFCSNVVGNSGRNRFYGPRLTTFDMSLFKNTKIPAISEAMNVQFRAEFFNVLNHTNYLSPGFLNTGGQNNSVYDANGSGLPTALNQTSTTSRQIQLGVKVVF